MEVVGVETTLPRSPVRDPGCRVAKSIIDSSSEAVRLPGYSRRRMTRVLWKVTKTDLGRGSGLERLQDRGKSCCAALPLERGVMRG